MLSQALNKVVERFFEPMPQMSASPNVAPLLEELKLFYVWAQYILPECCPAEGDYVQLRAAAVARQDLFSLIWSSSGRLMVVFAPAIRRVRALLYGAARWGFRR